MTPEDWEEVAMILRQGISTGDATFETEVCDYGEWDHAHMPRPRLVVEREGIILGWAAISPVSERPVYAGVAQVSIYVREGARGRGIGRRLLRELIHRSEEAGIWTLQASIFPENKASLKLHRSCGFRQVGRREKLGQLQGRWRDVLLFERRSPRVGQWPQRPLTKG
jgi:phosphinothricin acetyltransferase